MNVFEAVKQSVTARQAAEMYGIKVRRNGMACCPFHNDKNPSMKLDKRYHCFGCQADGDAIDFTARLFGLNSKEAALKLAADFFIVFDAKGMTRRGERRSSRRYGKNCDTVRQNRNVSGCYPIITIYCAGGNGIMPQRPRRRNGIRFL